MQFSTIVLAFAASVSAQSSASFDPQAASISLLAALPTSIAQVAITNPAAASTLIAQQFATGTPTWFAALPTAVQSFFLAMQNPVASGSGSSAASTASITSSASRSSATGVLSNVTSALASNVSSIIRTNATSSRTGALTTSTRASNATGSATVATGAAAVQTAFQYGVAGVAGLVGFLAL